MYINIARLLSVFCFAILAACGGDSEGGSAGVTPPVSIDVPRSDDPTLVGLPPAPVPPVTSNPVTTPPAPTPPVTSNPGTAPPTPVPPVTSDPGTAPPVLAVLCSSEIDAALRTGDPSALTSAAPVAKCASEQASIASARQAVLSAALYKGASSEYTITRSSQFVNPFSIEVVQPFIVGDKGNNLASVGIAGNGRSAAYGTNILDSFRDGNNMAHAPAFRALLSWLVSGDAGKPLAETITVTYTGIGASSISDGFAKAGVKTVATACSLTAGGRCSEPSQLLVIGQDVPDSAELESRVLQLLAAKKPILYVHGTTFRANEAGRKVLAAMSMTFGGVNGNYFQRDSVAPGRPANVNLAAFEQFGKISPFLRNMAENTWRTDYDWSKCSGQYCDNVPGLKEEVLDTADLLRASINDLTSAGRNVFFQRDTTLYRLLALWADVVPRDIRYPMDKMSQTKAFMQTLVADGLVAYVRPIGAVQKDLGTFARGSTAQLPVSSTDEILTITLPDTSGFTTIGRYVIPGKTMNIQVLESGGATLSLRLNTQRTGSTRLWTVGYNRPLYLSSPAIALNSQAETAVTSPYGGTMQLVYANAVAGSKIRVRVRGVAKHPFLDLTAGTDLSAFISEISNTPFDWAEIKLFGVEIHTRVDKMKEALADEGYGNDLNRYLTELQLLFVKDAYQLAGFPIPDSALPPAVTAFCSAQGWDCTDKAIHRLPGVQHFNSDIYANCGAGCSGNPIDESWGVAPRGWGESHELGHNLQEDLLKVYDGRSGEVMNNIFPLHKDWRMLRELGVDRDTKRLAYKSVFEMIKAARTESDPIQGAYQRIWGSDAYAAQNGERMAFYIQWVHYWEERAGDKARGWEIVTQLYLHQRLFMNADWASYKDKLGYSNYATRPPVSGNDNLLIALSWITKRDQRATFDLWGVTYTPEAAAQVTSFGFPREVALFYANNTTNNHDTVVKIDMSVQSPVWPF